VQVKPVLPERKNKKIQLAYYCMSQTQNREGEEDKHTISGGENYTLAQTQAGARGSLRAGVRACLGVRFWQSPQDY